MVRNTFHGPRALQLYLEMLDAGPAERKELARVIPANVGHYVPSTEHDTGFTIKPARELVLSEAIEGTDLIQTEFYATVIQGAEPRRCMREFLPTINMTKGSSMNLPKVTSGGYADDVAEGADIPKGTGKYSAATATPKKIGVMPEITKEMVDDSAYGVIAIEVSRAGQMIENKFNRDALLAILSNANIQEHDSAGSNLGAPAVLSARRYVKDANYIPDRIVLTSDLEYQLGSTLIPTATSPGYRDYIETGVMGKIFGLSAYETSVSTGNPTYVWDYDSDGEFGGIVADGTALGFNVIRQDITVENFTDPRKQLRSATVTMRKAHTIVNGDASCRLEY